MIPGLFRRVADGIRPRLQVGLLMLLIGLAPPIGAAPTAPEPGQVVSVLPQQYLPGEGEPATPRLRSSPMAIRLDAVMRAALPTVTAAADRAAITALHMAPTTPPTIGVPVPLPELDTAEAMAGSLRRIGASAEGLLLGVRIHSPGAIGLRLGLLVESLPAEAELAVFAAESSDPVKPAVTGEEINGLLAANRVAGDRAEAGRTYWGPMVDGDEAILVFRLPHGTDPSRLQVALPRLSHIFAEPIKTLAAGSCNLDLSCYSNSWGTTSTGVALMLYTKDGNTGVCTGTLLNDKDPSGFVPYLISANHCIATQTVASTLITVWFYQSAACNSGSLDSRATSLASGADLLYNSTETDTSFLRLRASPPTGVTYLGWTNEVAGSNTPVLGIHHPEGDYKKISFGSIDGYLNCAITGSIFTCASSPTGKYIEVDWSSGTTEAGSSGSGLLKTNGQLIGTLTGGNENCTSQTGTSKYGRFDIPFNAALHQWLNATSQSPAPTYNSVIYKHSDKCQDVRGADGTNGADVIQWPCHGGNNQKLQLVSKGNGYYSLVYKHSGLCTDVYGGGTAAGERVIQWPCHGGDNQLFSLEDMGGGYYAFRYKHSGQCIDVYGGGTEDAANVIQWPCHGGDNQLFRFSP